MYLSVSQYVGHNKLSFFYRSTRPITCHWIGHGGDETRSAGERETGDDEKLTGDGVNGKLTYVLT